MRRPTLVAVAGGGLAAALALGAAVPALASGSTPSTATASSSSASASAAPARLTHADLVTIDRFFENHPVLGHRLVHRIDAWKTFLANHPAFAAKLQHWKTLPPAQRRAEMHAWLADHPTVRHDLRKLRADRRELRQDLRKLRHDLRP